MNPFITYGYQSQKLFCNRKKETSKIIEALENGRNLTLFSLRKIGKTGLIHNSFDRMKKSHKKDGFVYIDISPADDLKSFMRILAQSIVTQLESKPAAMIKEAALMLKSIRPKMSYDPVSGTPSFSLFFESRDETESSFLDTMKYLKDRSMSQQIYVAVDEFQRILDFPEKNLEALLRSQIQFMNDVHFIFSGSEQKMMMSMFADARRPFYQSTQMMHLDKIDKTEYSDFIQARFEEEKINIKQGVVELILRMTRVHTFYVQYLCNSLYNLKIRNITEDDVMSTLIGIMQENENVYYSYRAMLRDQQWKVLRAIALSPGIQQVTSKDFLSKYDLGSHSTVSSAIKSLLSKELIYEEKGAYYVYDVFFSRWLERL